MGLRAMAGLRTSDMSIYASQFLVTKAGGKFLGKTIDFVTSSLRSATDIYKKGGHVTMEYRDQDNRVMYGNTRKVTGEIQNATYHPDGTLDNGFYKTKP
jgi:hypothetical protein